MAFRIQLRRDTSDKWALNNPILLNGEIGYETNTTYIKIGDGTTYWNDLAYWTGGVTGAGLIVKNGGITVQSPTNVLDFNSDYFYVGTGIDNTAFVTLSNPGGSSSTSIASITGSDGTGITGATGMVFVGSTVTAQGKVAVITSTYVPYFSVTIQLSGANFGSFASSRGPDGEPLTGPNWNFSLSNSGNNVTVTHNTGGRPIGLATHAVNGSSVFIKSPVGTSNTQFTLASDTSYNSFTVYGVNTGFTNAGSSSTVDIVWQFGASL